MPTRPAARPGTPSPNGSTPDLDSFVDNLPGNVYRRVRKPDGTYVFEYLSNGLFRQFGIDHLALLRQDTIRFDWIHPDDKERFVTDLEMSAATLGVLDHRVRIVGHQGRVYWARGIARPNRRPDGSVVWDGIVIDVTREIEAETALRIAKDEADRAHRQAAGAITSALERVAQPLRQLETALAALAAMPSVPARLHGQLADVEARLRDILATTGQHEAEGAAAEPYDGPSTLRALTRRQGDVLALIRAGHSNKAIAQKLGITPGTAKLHVSAVLRHLGLRRRSELVAGVKGPARLN